ncbi:chromatin associated protein KTI12 [Jimgerdemannia flammicorona]|uniref:Chromatin associated protein KTI12 n=1 Tax=Jimgerdemannia flammicorona TaxID=994334 RepID=A0A433QEF1_9FUNG|nr:chromatin associated protein KTI12 [Jimgerdemannia flammicorona]
MPLVILTGYPSCGKTSRAAQIREYFSLRISETGEVRKLRIHLVNDELLNLSRDAYRAVERLLSKDDIVIADAMNYIKGFRYQLYCLARAIGTPHCVVHCGTPVETARQWNTARGVSCYDQTIFNELITRYEEPESQNRWDSPLFTILCDDATVPGERIWDAVVLRKPPPPNLSTVVKPVSETNYLFELDKVTQDIITAVLEGQRHLSTSGGCIVVPLTTHQVQVPARTITLAELRRLRRQFANINKMHTLLDMERVAKNFVDYLNTNLS